MPRILIIAYGNPLRSDDGVAWRAADLLAEKLPASDVEILRLHQLTPELADTVREFQRVIFVDAASCEDSAAIPGEIHVEEVSADSNEPTRFSHAFSPQRVLALAVELYAARPSAFLVTVIGGNFDHGDSLSPAVAASLPSLVATIERLRLRGPSRA